MAGNPFTICADVPARGARRDPIAEVTPRWAVGAGIAAPALLIGGICLGTALQPVTYDPVRDTISQLAGAGASDRWVMTSALVGVGVSYVLVGLGLKPARVAGRTLLVCGGVATLFIAGFPQPHAGYSLAHELAVIVAALACCSWPVFAAHRRDPVLLLRRGPSGVTVGILLGLATWYALESHGALLGIAERVAATAPALWVLAVVVACRYALTDSERRGSSLPAGGEE
jgi:hypothetical membrane protein